MSEEIITTKQARDGYAYLGINPADGQPLRDRDRAERFDRWLKHVKAEAWDEGAWSRTEVDKNPYHNEAGSDD